MNPDIERLINIARESGELTEKQREIILRKADAMGEDRDEVEMVLETIKPASQVRDAASERRMTKCPHCGAIIHSTTFVCPECGFVLQKENISSADAREVIKKLQKDLMEAANSSQTKNHNAMDVLLQKDRQDRLNRQLQVINTFTMPLTKEGLTQMLEFAYSNYVSTDASDWEGERIKDAWYGRCVQAYNSLQRVAGDDADLSTVLQKYAKSLKTEKKKLSPSKRVTIWCIIGLLVVGAIIYYGAKGESASHEKVEQYLQKGDFQGARNAAKTYSDRELVSVSEVLHLISVGDYRQAKMVAATIEDKDKREEMMEAISESESSR